MAPGATAYMAVSSYGADGDFVSGELATVKERLLILERKSEALWHQRVRVGGWVGGWVGGGGLGRGGTGGATGPAGACRGVAERWCDGAA
jgi:hypothetical protein